MRTQMGRTVEQGISAVNVVSSDNISAFGHFTVVIFDDNTCIADARRTSAVFSALASGRLLPRPSLFVSTTSATPISSVASPTPHCVPSCPFWTGCWGPSTPPCCRCCWVGRSLVSERVASPTISFLEVSTMRLRLVHPSSEEPDELRRLREEWNGLLELDLLPLDELDLSRGLSCLYLHLLPRLHEPRLAYSKQMPLPRLELPGLLLGLLRRPESLRSPDAAVLYLTCHWTSRFFSIELQPFPCKQITSCLYRICVAAMVRTVRWSIINIKII